MSSRRPLIAGNWKMNGLRQEGLALAGEIARESGGSDLRCDLLICPPFTLIGEISQQLGTSSVAIGGQDCHAEAKGAHTGDVSAEMLADLGCRYVIVGHSERRADHGESSTVVRSKAAAALRAGLVPIICVGETEAERDAGKADQVVRSQLAESLPEGIDADRLVVAYEPVWAIGTGRTARPEDVGAMHAAIRELLSERVANGADVPILYGGSVKPENARELLAVKDVGGALVGGASLKAEDFLAIARSCG